MRKTPKAAVPTSTASQKRITPKPRSICRTPGRNITATTTSMTNWTKPIAMSESRFRRRRPTTFFESSLTYRFWPDSFLVAAEILAQHRGGQAVGNSEELLRITGVYHFPASPFAGFARFMIAGSSARNCIHLLTDRANCDRQQRSAAIVLEWLAG